MSRTSRKKKISIITGVNNTGSVNAGQMASAYLLFLKQQKKGYIEKYLRQLPQTYTVSSGIVRKDDELLDIREKEIKNSTVVDPFSTPSIPVSSKEGVVKEKKYYRIPMFHKVKHHQRLTKAFDEAYSAYVRKLNPKIDEMILIHQKAFEKGLEAMNEYSAWVFKNNEKLVKDFPEYFSFKDNTKNEDAPKVKVETKGEKVLNSLKKLFKGWDSKSQ